MVDAIILEAEEAIRLCERLWDSVSLGPGLQNAVFAMPEVRSFMERLRAEIPATDVSHRLLEIEALFEKWFSDRDWRGHDQGRSFHRDLYSKIRNLRTSVKLWYSSRSMSYR